jgi:hypothetical protein
MPPMTSRTVTHHDVGTSPSRLRWTRRSRVLTVVAALVASTTLAACSAAGGASQASRAITGQTGVTLTELPLPAGVEHVHALVRDAATGRILAATHAGLYDITQSGAASRVGEGTDDLMSLTVDGSGDLYASGHPATGSSATDPLGLIRSSDGGRNWAPVSREGESDFHALTVHGSTIVGLADTTLATSRDAGRTWQVGAHVDAATLTLDSSTLWVTGPSGLQRSSDDGASLKPVADAPKLRLGSAAIDDTVWGVGDDGTVWRRDDRGLWTRVARLPFADPVSALVAVTPDRAMVATGSQLVWIDASGSTSTA